MSNEITKHDPNVGVHKPKLFGLAAKRAEALAKAQAEGKPVEKSPSDYEHRIGIVFDDSGSMAGQAIKDAHQGVEEFLRSCTKDQTAVAVYPLNAEALPLNSNLPAVAIMASQIPATGGTYIKRAVTNMFAANSLTRAIIFSDGSNGDGEIPEEIFGKGIPIDTVYIQDYGEDSNAVSFLKKIAEKSGGIFLHFKRGQSNFATAFKYLSPGLRYMLADKSFVNKLEGK